MKFIMQFTTVLTFSLILFGLGSSVHARVTVEQVEDIDASVMAFCKQNAFDLTLALSKDHLTSYRIISRRGKITKINIKISKPFKISPLPFALTQAAHNSNKICVLVTKDLQGK